MLNTLKRQRLLLQIQKEKPESKNTSANLSLLDNSYTFVKNISKSKPHGYFFPIEFFSYPLHPLKSTPFHSFFKKTNKQTKKYIMNKELGNTYMRAHTHTNGNQNKQEKDQ